MNAIGPSSQEFVHPWRSRRGLPGVFAAQHPQLQVSFEFFPPRTEDMELTLWRSIEKLEPLSPRFVSVTYGAGGSTRERTHATVRRILTDTTLVPAAHLTCVDASRDEVDDVVRGYWVAGVRHIVALRGDPPDASGMPGLRRPLPGQGAATLRAGAALGRGGPGPGAAPARAALADVAGPLSARR